VLDAESAQGVPAYLGGGSQVERVEGVGHFMLVEKPEQINQRILRFLAGG
jgi:pimeloyl-ACP methyl ester carboxylesterase